MFTNRSNAAELKWDRKCLLVVETKPCERVVIARIYLTNRIGQGKLEAPILGGDRNGEEAYDERRLKETILGGQKC